MGDSLSYLDSLLVSCSSHAAVEVRLTQVDI